MTQETPATGDVTQPSKQGDGKWGGVVIVVVLMVIPGAIFLAKGAIEFADRVVGHETRDATLVETETVFVIVDGESETLYRVHGELAGGGSFQVDDERLYDIADGSTPLPVRVETSGLNDRVLAVRSDFGNVDGVAGAGNPALAIVAIVLGIGLLLIPFALVLRSGQRKQAIAKGEPPPEVHWAGFTVICIAIVLTFGATLAWDLLR